MRRDGQMDWVREIRDQDIVMLRVCGHSLRDIGRRFRLSHVRVLKILRERGADGAAHPERSI